MLGKGNNFIENRKKGKVVKIIQKREKRELIITKIKITSKFIEEELKYFLNKLIN